MITVLHRDGPANDYGITWGWCVKSLRYTMNLGLLHQKYHFQRLDKKIRFLSVGKKVISGGYAKLLQLYIRGVRRNDYSIT